jgi:hypothetical protein
MKTASVSVCAGDLFDLRQGAPDPVPMDADQEQEFRNYCLVSSECLGSLKNLLLQFGRLHIPAFHQHFGCAR